ncbi:MAG: hypothetical protein ACWGPR_11825 [Candidatus Deferrimicrobiaceae bacterium]
MIGHLPWFFPVGAEADAWAARYDLEPTPMPCPGCGVERVPDRPFAAGPWRGLCCYPCKCGNERTPYCAVRADGDFPLGSGAA